MSRRPTGTPGRERWQPTRAGLVDLFYYDEEEFAFRDGHLLLRGNNGTGKSKVLALLLPFLLEGDTSAHRVEPDGDPSKRMEWNLLLGGRHPNSERTGYAWCEFGRRDGDTERWVTIGAGLKATSARAGVKSWFFVTDRRVGDDLHLLGPDRTVLTAKRLSEALGERGRVFEQASAYRNAVNEALFDLSQERYEALLSLLVQLRQPQLSKRPDEKRLSAALTEALTPLDGALVADVADAFRSLEDERLAVAAHHESRQAAVRFLRTYTDYARVAARRRAGAPRRTQSVYEETGRRIVAARTALDEATAREQAVAGELAAVGRQQTLALADREALRESEEMRSADRLAQLRARAEELAKGAVAADRERREAEENQTRRSAELGQRESELAGATTAAEMVRSAADDAAQRAGIAVPSSWNAAARPDVEQAVATRRRAVEQIRVLARAERAAAAELAVARTQRDAAARDADAVAERLDAARRDADQRGRDLVEQAEQWLGSLVELGPLAELQGDGPGVLERLAGWMESLAGDNPLSQAANAAARQAHSALGRLEQEHAAELRVLAERDTALDRERVELEAGTDRPPPASATRDAAGRTTRPGAPLWRLVDLTSELGPADAAGLEAALQASGLLDAWVTPDGGLLDADDVTVTVAAGVENSLAAVLRPAVNRGDLHASTVPDSVVTAVLGGIGLGAATAPTWVDAAGRFRVGVLEGRWSKPVSEFLGSGARAAARRARLAEIATERSVLAQRRAEVQAAAAEVARRRRTVDAEMAAEPSDAPLRDAHATARERAAEHRRAAERLSQRENAVRAAAGAQAQAASALGAAAAERDMPDDDAGLQAVADAVHELDVAAAGYWPLVAAVERARSAVVTAGDELRRAVAVHQRRSEEASASRKAASAAADAAEALRSTVGALVEELERRLAAVELRLVELGRTHEQLDDERLRLRDQVGEARGRAEGLAAQLEKDAEARDLAVEGLRAFARTGLLQLAVPDIDVPDAQQAWPSSSAVLLARGVEAALADVDSDDPARERATRRVIEGLSALGEVLSRSGDAVSHVPSDEGIVVFTTFRSRRLTLPELTDELTTELFERERLLSARERDLLETHLVTEVAARLAELIRAAEAQVERMNAEMAQRPTSTGMQLRFLWTPVPDGPAGLPEARARLLRQRSDAWSEGDRRAVGDFLQAQIAAVRARDEGGTWGEHLATALDYRHWHRFVVQRRSDGAWRPATGPASGGERVLAATIPLFAAAASHYATARNPFAPRLVLLDEAFAGVDDDSRAKCLGLLAEFDLDYVLTSEREWGCYDTVPGLAIAQLSRRDGIDAVLVTRWEWDGHRRRRVEEPRRAAAAPAPAAVEAAPDALEVGLWG